MLYCSELTTSVHAGLYGEDGWYVCDPDEVIISLIRLISSQGTLYRLAWNRPIAMRGSHRAEI
jgi:hypothetical protein